MSPPRGTRAIQSPSIYHANDRTRIVQHAAALLRSHNPLETIFAERREPPEGEAGGQGSLCSTPEEDCRSLEHGNLKHPRTASNTRRPECAPNTAASDKCLDCNQDRARELVLMLVICVVISLHLHLRTLQSDSSLRQNRSTLRGPIRPEPGPTCTF